MTEFEELALKKITKDFLVDCIYNRINTISARYGISNVDISTYIGWDSAGFNQKYNRSNDLRITTFVKIYSALIDLITQKETEMGLSTAELSVIRLEELITPSEVNVAELFNHISHTVEGITDFLNTKDLKQTYIRMKPFVLVSKRNKRFSDREIDVYINYFKSIRHQ